MKEFKGYADVQVNEGGVALPVGGYICKIVGARVEKNDTCEILKVAFDISEGEFANYYKDKFEADKVKSPDAKWKGVFDVFVPKDDGSEMDGYTKQAFKRFTTSIEKSNSGYIWAWQEQTLSGKLFGGIFGREEFLAKDSNEYKFAVKCRWANSTETVRSGKFKLPADKMTKEHKGQAATQSTGSTSPIPPQFEEALADGQLPF